MTRAELIRKISKQSGVPDSETKVFFEIFLKKLMTVLKTGQALFVNGFGYFYQVQGKINKALSADEEDSPVYEVIDLIYFSNNHVKEKTEFDGLFFNIPVTDEDEFNSVDAAFSLSFGKPLIPFKGIVETDFYIPHTGSELRRLIESKVDKTVENSTITEVSKILSSVIDLDSDIYNKSKLKPDEDVSDLTFEDYLSEKDISKQIEEEQILDLADTIVSDKEVKDSPSAVSWDFGGFEKIKAEEKKKPKVTDDQIEGADTTKIKIDYDKAELNEKPIEEEDEKKKDSKEKFERVKTLDKITDKTIDRPVITFPTIFFDKSNQEPIKEEPVKLIFNKNTSAFIGIEPKGRSVREKYKREKAGKPEKPLVDKSKRNILSIEEEKEKFRQRHKRKKPSSSITPYILLVVSIGIIAYGIYYYLNNIKGASKQQVQEPKIQFNTDRMNIVERDFDYPVSYPYPKRTEIDKDVLNIFDIKKEEAVSKVKEEPDEIVKVEKPKETPKEIKPEVKNQPPAGTVKRIDVNLFLYGNVYIVQVAAFRSISVAENEAGRFRNKGYNAFVERAEVDGTVWHRVKVGNFTNLEEAKKLAVQFK